VSLTGRKQQFKPIGLLILLTISLFFPFIQNNFDYSYEENRDANFVKTSAQRSVTTQWIKNPTFESPIEPTWYWENGSEGDNSDMDATTSTGQANYEVLGETRTFTVVSGIINSSSSPDWLQFRNSDFQYPDTAEIRSYGGYVSHEWADDTNQAPSVHWKTNISIPIDISEYIITSASLEVIVNASVSSNVDTPNDSDWENFAIGDSVTYYSQISDLGYNPPRYTVASNKTKYLGQNSPQRLNITDSPLENVGEIDLITALNSAFDKDPSHSNFTLTLGIDIYSEDNLGGTDTDTFDDLIIKSCNLTFTVKKKIDQATTLSWNQVGNTLDSSSVQVTDAKFFFKYKINNTWPISAPLSEIIFYINDKSYDAGIIKLASATTSWQEAKVGGFDVTTIISTDVNTTISIEVFLKDTFELDQIYSISIDDVYLNISYVETFPDYGTDLVLFLDGEDKTIDPVIQIPIKDMLNVTVTYKENVSGNHITADSATLEGKVSGDLTENSTFEHYYFSVNTTELGLGISVLTVTLQKINYETKFVQIFVKVLERETKLHLFVEETPRSNNETINVLFNELLNITVFYKDNLTNTFINAASVELLGFGFMNETLNQYNFTLNTNDLSQGVNVLTIFAQKNNYQSNSFKFYINVVERASKINLFVNSTQKYDSDTFYSQFNEFLNLTIYYRDNLTNQLISNASVSLLGFGDLNETSNHYYFILDTNNLSQGVNILTFYAQKDNYQYKTIKLFVNIQVRTTFIRVFVEGIERNNSDAINTQFGEQLNITIFYRDNVTNAHLTGAFVALVGIGDFSEIGTQFNFTISANNFENGLNILTIFAQLNGFQDQAFQILLDIYDRETELLLFINDFQRYDAETINYPYEEVLNITILYRDNVTKQHITNTTVNLLGLGVLDELSNQYNYTLSTNDLNQGINVLTILCTKVNFQSQTIQFVINIQERETYIRLFIEGFEIFDSNTYNSQFNEILNITILYRDTATVAHLNGANIDLLGYGNFSESGSQFNLTLDTNNLAEGTNALTIISIKDNYQSKTIQFFIDVQERATYIRLFIEEIEIFDLDTIDTQFDEFLNITVLYRDNIRDTHITGASIDLLGIGNLTEIGSQFNYTLNANTLDHGVNILTVFAQFDGHKPQRIQFFINVEERNTRLSLYINNLPKSQGESIKVEANEQINITVYYRDGLTNDSLSLANIELLGFGGLIQTGLYYNITINSNSLEKGVNILTLFAQLSNYQARSVQFIIEVVDRATIIQLLLNGEDVTFDPVFEIPIESIVNVTVKYLDNQTGIGIPDAFLQLIGEDLYQNLTESLLFNQYSIIINTSILLIGVKLFTIVASAPNYQINTIYLRITVNRVRTSIYTVSGLNFVDINPGENFLIQIVLNNTDFGGTIRNATVTYRWDNGQGILTDSNNDGIYEAILNNVPAGSYRISINAYAGENYDFRDDFEIVLNVISPPGPDITLIIILLAAGVVGLSVFFVLYQIRFKYPPKVRMMRKMRKKIDKGKNLKPITVNSRSDIITSEIARNKEILSREKEVVVKVKEKLGGESLE
jgi:hypothetical protein